MIIAAAALVGLGALVLPIPESVFIEPIVAPEPKKVPTPAPPAPPRAANRAKPAAKPPPPPKPPAKVIPPSDTTKARGLVQPNAKK